MNFEVASSAYDSASSRTHPPHSGAALKSINRGLVCAFASASAASTSLFQLTAIFLYLLSIFAPSGSEDLLEGHQGLLELLSKHALRRRFLPRPPGHPSRSISGYSAL